MPLSGVLDRHKIYAFIDLDDTFLQIQEMHLLQENIIPTSKNERGDWHSYSSPAQLVLFSLLQKAHVTIIPTTARTFAGLSRINLPLSFPAICAHGGVIMTEGGVPCPQWRSETKDLNRWATKLKQVKSKITEALSPLCGDKLGINIISDDQRDLYLSLKLRSSDFLLMKQACKVLEDLKAHDSQLCQWKILDNGRTLGFLPPALCKSRAVDWYIKNFCEAGSITLGIGDSLSDLNFMSLCDYSVIPKETQIYAEIMRFKANA